MIVEMNRLENTFDEEKCWIEYKDGNSIGYELVSWNAPLNPKPGKIAIKDLETADEIKEVLYSDNEMLYVDEEEERENLEYMKDLLKRIERDIKKYPQLSCYFDNYEGVDVEGQTIVIYGGIITEVLF